MSATIALLVGIADYPPPTNKLDMVSNDIDDFSELLGSPQGTKELDDCTVLKDDEATVTAHAI